MNQKGLCQKKITREKIPRIYRDHDFELRKDGKGHQFRTCKKCGCTYIEDEKMSLLKFDLYGNLTEGVEVYQFN